MAFKKSKATDLSLTLQGVRVKTSSVLIASTEGDSGGLCRVIFSLPQDQLPKEFWQALSGNWESQTRHWIGW